MRPIETSAGNSPIYPMDILHREADQALRRIEDCWWFHPVQIDFDITSGKLPRDPLHRDFMLQLGASLVNQGHGALARPGEKSDMIIGFYDLPKDDRPLMERVPEEETLRILQAREKYDINTFDKNYTLVVTLPEDIAAMPKREAEKVVRMLMARLGALKILMIHPDEDGEAKYYAFGTMEGGLGIEDAKKDGAIDRIRDRLVTHACARESGKFESVPNAIEVDQWKNSTIPDVVARVSRQLASWGYIDKPFDTRDVASDARASLINRIMGWSRQSESALAAWAADINPPSAYQMGPAKGVIVSSKSGRFGADKTQLKREDTIPVAIVPLPDYHPGQNDPLSLYGFNRYSLGVEDQEVGGPSIEFDEMAAAILYSGFVRVKLHPNGQGFQLDMQNGNIYLPRVRGFVHLHQGVSNIKEDDFVEYVPANLRDYPYPVGCGKDIMFACSTDAARRSFGAHSIGSGIQIALFDASNHGTNVLLLTEPIVGTDFIPFDPFQEFMKLVNPETGVVSFTSELAMV